jgi:hypothetical protein
MSGVRPDGAEAKSEDFVGCCDPDDDSGVGAMDEGDRDLRTSAIPGLLEGFIAGTSGSQNILLRIVSGVRQSGMK